MLRKFKTQHIRKILWILVFIIIPAFILWGSISYLTLKKKSAIGKIENHIITKQEFYNYIRLAQLHYSFISQDYLNKATPSQIESQAWEFYLFLWKAKKEKIKVSDDEVVDTIKKIFSFNGKFDKERYFRFLKYRLRVEPRTFEEYIRKRLIIEKLLDKLIHVKVDDKEILDLYKKENEKAKIGYILLPYESFEKEVKIDEKTLEDYYQKNKDLFKEEPKVKIKYIFISQDTYEKLKQKVDKAIRHTKNIKELSKFLNLPYKESTFLTLNTPIEGIGWQPEVIKRAFSLPKNSLSKLIKTDQGYIIFEKVEEKPTRIPPFKEIKEKVKKKFIEEERKKLALEYAKKLLEDLKEKKIKTLKDLAKIYKLDYKESNYFKYYDYIEGVGLNKKLSDSVFSAEKGKILFLPFALKKGIYLVEVKDLMKIDEKKFSKEKKKYKERILTQKKIIAQLQLLTQIEKESNFKIFSYFYPQQQS